MSGKVTEIPTRGTRRVLPACFQEPLLPPLGSLLDAAAAAGQARADVEPADLLLAVAGLCVAAHADQSRRMVALLIDGLLCGAHP